MSRPAAARGAKHNALLFTKAEIDAFDHIAKEAGFEFDAATLKTVELRWTMRCATQPDLAARMQERPQCECIRNGYNATLSRIAAEAIMDDPTLTYAPPPRGLAPWLRRHRRLCITVILLFLL